MQPRLPASSPLLLTLSGVGLFKNGRWLVRGIDLSLARNEIVTLIGPNGSGKSSTIKMALGIEKPNEGWVQRPDNLRVSYVPQRIMIDWTLPLTVQRFMVLVGKLSPQAVSWAMEATGTAHLAKQQVRSLSGGELQRVLLARAIARKPELLVLDEPVQGVDFKGETELYHLIQQIRQDLQCGILLVSHDLHVVMAATDKVICLNGTLCCSGTPISVATNEHYHALFGERAVAGLALYHHQHTGNEQKHGPGYSTNRTGCRKNSATKRTNSHPDKPGTDQAR